MCSLGQMTQSLQTTFKGGNRRLSLKGDSRLLNLLVVGCVSFNMQLRNMGKLKLQAKQKIRREKNTHMTSVAWLSTKKHIGMADGI